MSLLVIALFCEHREGSFFFLPTIAKHVTFAIESAILIMKGDSFAISFFHFFKWRHMRRFFFVKFSEEHLTLENPRDILIIVQQMVTSICFFDLKF